MGFQFGQQIIDMIRGKQKCSIKSLKYFYKCLSEFKTLDKEKRFSLSVKDFWIQLYDNTETTGFDTQYEYHQAWAARCLAKINPQKHIDISSRITFNVVTSAFIPIEFYDYRPAQIYNLSNLACKSADLNKLSFEDNSIESLSCMHRTHRAWQIR